MVNLPIAAGAEVQPCSPATLGGGHEGTRERGA